MSRSIGDLEAGDLVPAAPEVRQVTLPTAGARLVIASDGVWDQGISAKSLVGSVRKDNAAAAAQKIAMGALKRKGLRDDITVLVVDFLPAGAAADAKFAPGSSITAATGQLQHYRPLETASTSWRAHVAARRHAALEHARVLAFAAHEQREAENTAAAVAAAAASASAPANGSSSEQPSESYLELAQLVVDVSDPAALLSAVQEEDQGEQLQDAGDGSEWTEVGPGKASKVNFEADIKAVARSRGSQQHQGGGRGSSFAGRGRGSVAATQPNGISESGAGYGSYRGRGRGRHGGGAPRECQGADPQNGGEGKQESQIQPRAEQATDVASAAPAASAGAFGGGYSQPPSQGRFGRGGGRGRGRGSFKGGTGGQQCHSERLVSSGNVPDAGLAADAATGTTLDQPGGDQRAAGYGGRGRGSRRDMGRGRGGGLVPKANTGPQSESQESGPVSGEDVAAGQPDALPSAPQEVVAGPAGAGVAGRGGRGGRAGGRGGQYAGRPRQGQGEAGAGGEERTAAPLVRVVPRPPKVDYIRGTGRADSSVKCFRCEQVGHFARDCPAKDAPSNPVNGPA